MRARFSLLSLALALVVPTAACQISPRNGDVVTDTQKPIAFISASHFPSDTLRFQIQDQMKGTWHDYKTVATASKPDVTDVAGQGWYLGTAELRLPISLFTAQYFRHHGGSQRRLSADFQTYSDKYKGAFQTFDSTAAADVCVNDTYEQSGGLMAALQCASSQSPETQVFGYCGKANQACCYSFQATTLCDAGRVCDHASARCTIAAGGEGEFCNDDASCNPGSNLVCSNENKCIDAKGTTVTGRWFTAYQSCSPGSADCNVCAPNVKAQFDRAVGDDQWFQTLDRNEAMTWKAGQWNFVWDRNYYPSGRTPNNVFNQHIQGFARTNDDRIKYVGTYGNDGSGGGIFFIEQNSSGVKHMVNMIGARHEHPSGVSVFGKYVMLSDASNEIRMVDINRRATNHTYAWGAPGAKRAGGGLGMAKLSNGSRLLIVVPGGGDDEDARYYRFYNVSGNIEGSPTVVDVGNWTYSQPSGWSGDYRYTENISVISECGTGDIYVVSVSASWKTSINTGHWLLSKVVQKAGQGLTLQPIKAYFGNQTQHRCSTRSSGTVWINDAGQIEPLCSERASTNGWLDGNEDTLRFQYGVF